MVEQAAQNYADIIRNVNPEREINPICTNIEDMLARLDEFETLLSTVKAETNDIMENHVSSILNFQENFQSLRERIDNLEQFVDIVNANVTEVEKSLDIAEEELNVTDYSLKGLLFKPLFAKAKASSLDEAGQPEPRTNLKDDAFQTVPIFKSSDYFGPSDLEFTDPAHDV